jgi:hypothetical protein
VNGTSLPYTLIILLVELAVGSLAFAVVADARAMVTRGYMKMAALVVVAPVVFALWTYAALGADRSIDGYALNESWLTAFNASLVTTLVLSALLLVAAFREQRGATLLFGAAGATAGLVTLVTLTAVIAPPTWSYAGALASLVVASAVLGGSLMAMSWGHWYLTNSGLPKEPMEQMSLFVVIALGVQLVLVVIGSVLPVREVPLTDAAFGVVLGRNPAFWLRIGVGIVFPLVTAGLAWRSATIRGMMSATGLLYLATGGILAGEVLARGLMFATAATV